MGEESRTLIDEKRQRNELRKFLKKWHPEWGKDYNLEEE